MLQDKLTSDNVLVVPTIVKDINPDNNGVGSSFISALSHFNGSLFFTADSDYNGYIIGGEMWKSDGTTAGTVPFGDIIFSL